MSLGKYVFHLPPFMFWIKLLEVKHLGDIAF